MRPLGKLVALAIFVIGVIGVVAPERLTAITKFLLTPPGLQIGAVLQPAMGIVLILVAPTSRAPRTARLIGVFLFFAGVIMPALDAERLRGLVDWTAVQSPWTLRGIGGLIGAVGGLAGFATDAKTRPA